MFLVVVSGSALHALYEMIDWNFRKFFETLKSLTEQFQNEKSSAEILRLCLLQLGIKHLSDLEIVMNEPAYAKGRLEQLLGVMRVKVQEYQANIRGEYKNEAESNESDTDSDDTNESETGTEAESEADDEEINREDDEETDEVDDEDEEEQEEVEEDDEQED